MNIERLKNGGVKITALDEFLAATLRALPGNASTEDEAAARRIYQSPTQGREPELDEEWREMSEPDLRQIFGDAIETVVADLAKIKRSKDGSESFEIPAAHIEPWMHALNRARLCLGARWGVEEDDMAPAAIPSSPQHGLALLHIEIYGFLLEFLVRGEMGGDEE